MKKKELLEKLFNLCVEIDGLENREAKDGPVVMFGFSGHVKRVHISVYSNGWATGVKADMKFSFYLDEEMYLESMVLAAIEALEKLKESLTC